MIDQQPTESDFQRRKRYEYWVENHPNKEGRVFSPWASLSQDDRDRWAAENPPIFANDEDISNVGKAWIEEQVASLTPEQREAAAIFFHGPKIGGPPSEVFFKRLGGAVLSQEQWQENYPHLVKAYRDAVNAKVYKL